MFGLKTLDLRVQWDGQYRQVVVGPGLLWLSSTASGSPTPTSTASASTPPSTWAKRRCGRSATSIREFAQSIGKERFLLVGRDRRQPRARLGGRGEDRAGRGPGDRGRPGQAGADGHRLRRPGGLLLPVPQLGAGGAGRAPLVSQPGGDPGGRPRPGPQGRRPSGGSAATAASATWRSTCWRCS